jgi:TetR/AcrR family transcriptional regulator, tetracycline repressor protein
VQNRAKAPRNKRARAASGEPATDGRSRSLWFNAPMADQDRRPPLSRERVVAEALTVIAGQGVQALTMRALAGRLGVVPGALYHHVRNKEQLHDLVLDGVLAEVDYHPDLDHSPPWTERLKVLAHRLRAVLEAHPGVAGILKTRDPLGPHSLALAEAVLAPLQAAGFGDREAGLAFFLLVDYTIGFAVSSPTTSVNEQRVRDAATRAQLHRFFRSLPADRFPALVALGEHVWVDNRDQRFTAGLQVLVDGLEQARGTPRRRTLGGERARPPEPPRPSEDGNTHSRQPTGTRKGGDPMSINARCGSCNRELLLGQLLQPSDGFRCPVCGFAFAPAYATVAPGVAARIMAAQADLVTALAELGSMTGGRLRLDPATVVGPIANTLPQAEAKQSALARRRHAQWWARGAATQPAQTISHQ